MTCCPATPTSRVLNLACIICSNIPRCKEGSVKPKWNRISALLNNLLWDWILICIAVLHRTVSTRTFVNQYFCFGVSVANSLLKIPNYKQLRQAYGRSTWFTSGPVAQFGHPHGINNNQRFGSMPVSRWTCPHSCSSDFIYLSAT